MMGGNSFAELRNEKLSENQEDTVLGERLESKIFAKDRLH